VDPPVGGRERLSRGGGGSPSPPGPGMRRRELITSLGPAMVGVAVHGRTRNKKLNSIACPITIGGTRPPGRRGPRGIRLGFRRPLLAEPSGRASPARRLIHRKNVWAEEANGKTGPGPLSRGRQPGWKKNTHAFFAIGPAKMAGERRRVLSCPYERPERLRADFSLLQAYLSRTVGRWQKKCLPQKDVHRKHDSAWLKAPIPPSRYADAVGCTASCGTHSGVSFQAHHRDPSFQFVFLSRAAGPAYQDLAGRARRSHCAMRHRRDVCRLWRCWHRSKQSGRVMGARGALGCGSKCSDSWRTKSKVAVS